MDKFPEDFTRQACNEIMGECQSELIKTVRQSFYETIQKSVHDCVQIVLLEFPDKLWNEHRETLIKELLDRFLKLTIKTFGGLNPDMTKTITKAIDIPINVKRVIIEFIKDS